MYQLENVGFQNVKSAMRCFGAGELERCIVGPFAAIPRFLLLPYPYQNGERTVRLEAASLQKRDALRP